MSIGPSTHRLFGDCDIQDVLTRRRQALFDMIDSLTDDQLCNTSMENVCRKLVREYSLDAPQIDESRIYLTTPSPPPPGRLDLLLRSLGLAVESGSVAKSRTRFIFHVPFTGNPQLFHCRPRMTPHLPLHAAVRDLELAFSYVGLRHDGNLIRMDFDRDLSSLKTSLVSIAQDVEEFNASLLEPVSKRIRARQDGLLHDRQIAESLGRPIRPATDLAVTSEPPTVEPDVAPQPPPVSPDPDAPQPSSDVPGLRIARDGKLVMRGDQDFPLSSTQARVFNLLWQAYLETGVPELGQDYIREELGWKDTRIWDVFKRSKAWRKLIGPGKATGSVRLIL